MSEKVGEIYYDVTADTSKLVGQSRVVDRETSRMAGSFNVITTAIKVLASALALVKIAQMADDFRLLAARVNVAAGSIERGAEAMGELRRISERTQTELSANVAVFNRLNQSIIQMGGNQRDTLQITELLGKAIKVSGASGAEAASAMTQFGQALGSGALQGDELRSLLENAPYLMRQLADGIGVPIGALKKLGEEGKLTADVVTNALVRAAGRIDADFQRLPQTFSSAFTAAMDAAMRANEALDTLTGTSAALTGVARGTGDVLNMIADRLLGVTTEGDRLARADQVGAWARSTTVVLSYVADAADFVSRAFRQAGIGLAGLAASAGAALTGNFTGARDVLRQVGADILAISDPQYAGAGIRQRIEALQLGTDGSDRLDRAARSSAPSQLRAPGGAAGAQGAAAAKKAADDEKKAADARNQGYIDQVEGEQRIQREADELRAKFFRDQQQRRDDEAEEEAKRAQERARNLAAAQDVIVGDDQIARLQLELERKSAALAAAAEADQENAEFYAEARVALEQQTQQRINDVMARQQADQQAAQAAMLANYGNLFGGLAELTRTFEGEQSSTYKAMFAVSKAFAIADSIIKIQQGVANALSLPYPANIAAAASTAASAAGLINTIKGTNYGGGRQYGGPVSAGSMYRVNETGRPEMYTASNGAQYMLPTANGSVTPADQVGGGVQWTIKFTNAPPGTTATVDSDNRVIDIAVARSEANFVRQMTDNSGPMFRALSGSTNVRGVL